MLHSSMPRIGLALLGSALLAAVQTALVQAGKATGVDFDTPPKATSADARSRTFQFTYSATVTGLPPEKIARIWVPVPPDNEEQDVEIVSRPEEGNIARESRFGNKILYLKAKANFEGKIPLTVTYKVTRRELKGDSKQPSENSDQLTTFLQPDAMVPITGKPLELIKDKKVPTDAEIWA